MNDGFYYNNNQSQPVYSSSQQSLLLAFGAIVLITIGYVAMTSGMFDKVQKVEATIDNNIVYTGKNETVKVKVDTNSEFNPVVRFRSKNGNFTVSEDIQYGKEVETKIIAKESGEDTLIIEVGKEEGKKDKVEEVNVLICESPKLLNTTDKTISIKEGNNLQLKFNVDNKCLEGYQIYAENENIADVDGNNLLRAKKSGKTTLVLKGSNTVKYTLNVKPLKVNVTGVRINTKDFNLAIGKTKNLSVTVKPSDATNKKVKYESSDSEIATVTKGGKVKGIKIGVATITVTSEDNTSKKDTIKVRVYKPEPPAPTVKVTSIKFDKTSESMYVGESRSLTTTISPSNATNKGISCTSNNQKVATAKVSGNACAVKGVGAGSAVITVTTKDGNKKATASVTVSKKPSTTVKVTSIKFDKTSDSVYVGDSKSLTTTISPSNATNKGISCASNNQKVATAKVSGNACVVKGVGAGSAVITVTTKDGSKKATASVTVSKKQAPVVKVTSAKFEKSSYSVSLNQTVVAVVGITPTNATNKTITCKSQNTSIATVTYSGNKCTIKGVKAGTTTIEAYSADGNKKATTEVKVLPIAVKSISFENTSYYMNVGADGELKVKFNPSNASNQVISCSSSDNGVATAAAKNTSCIIKGVKAGSVTITATSQDGNKTAKATMKVNPVLVTGVSFGTTSYSVDVGSTKTLPVTVSPSNATNKNYTCTSSDTSIATITSGCTVKGIKQGSATITVTTSDGSKTATTTVSVKNAIKKETIRVATFNLGGFYCGSYYNQTGIYPRKCQKYDSRQKEVPTSEVTAFLNQSKPSQIDILGIQEGASYSRIDQIMRETKLKYGFRTFPPNNGGGMALNAVVSKIAYKEKTVRTLRTCGELRYYDKAVYTINGVDISFYNSHLGLGNCNEKHFQDLAKIVKEDPNPIIMTADWNYTQLDRFKQYFIDPADMQFKIAGYDKTTNNMWGSAGYCDAVLVKPKGHIDIVSSEVVTTFDIYTDHNMVIATLNVY